MDLQTDYLIVCVDDDSDVLDITVELIKSMDYACEGFTNVEEAHAFIVENKPRITMVLSDLRMDNVNGFEFKRMLNKTADDIPFVIVTGYWTKEMSSEAMAIGIDAFVEKPISEILLQEYIEQFAKTRMESLDEDKEMVLGFLEESAPMLDEIESLILELEEQPDSEQTLSTYFRLLHTIKGTASCVGLTQLGDYTHKYEDFIGELRNKKLAVNTATTNVLLEGLDDLKEYFDDLSVKGYDHHLNITEKVLKYEPEQYKNANTAAEISNQENKTDSDNVEQVSKVKKDDDKMTVPMSLLNEFMEESGELTVIRNSILKTVKKIESKYRGDAEIELLNDLLDGMYNVTSNIQGKITEMRKISLKNVFRPFKRLVRDLSKQLNKQVELEILGEDHSVDNTITKLFNNTLIHILRNSLDHGLESSEARVAAGKDPVGNLTIQVEEEGEDIVLKIIDDGKGINPDIIRAKAIEKGLYTESELANMSEIEVVNIIFDSGFSTAEQVSDLSGRGVGMDMVRSSFQEMGGSVYVKSSVGKGSTFVLRVPIPKSVLIVNTLSVTCASESFIFHMDEVAEVVRYEKENANSKLYDIDGEQVLKHNNEMIQLSRLAKVLELEDNDSLQGDVYNIVVLRIGNDKFGLIVNEIHEFEEVVSRKINDQIVSNELFHGASLLGNGEVAMILSGEGLAKKIGIELGTTKETTFLQHEKETNEVDSDNFEYMLFKYNQDDYLSLNLDDVERLEKIHVETLELVGDNSIVRYQDKVLPLIEPAGMIGLHDINFDTFVNNYERDLLEVIVINYSGKQYGIVAHELDEIKTTAQSINQDVSSEGLLGTVYINETTLSVLDLRYIIDKYKSKKSMVKIGQHVA